MEEQKPRIGLIYMYTSPSGKIYIGQTINEKSRKSDHKSKTSKTDTYFGKAIRKYGFDNFTYTVLLKFKPTTNIEKLKRVLDKLEERYINLYKSNDKNFGYNLNRGGQGNLGYKHTEEMRSYLKTLPKTEEQLHNLTIRKHDKFTIEHKQKLSDAKKNKKKVAQYDLEENLLNTFNSIEAAASSIDSTEATQKTKANRISECCNEKRKTIYGSV